MEIRPEGVDGTMNIETGVFTTGTTGYYIIPFSGGVQLRAAEIVPEWTDTYLCHNGVQVEESHFESDMFMGDGTDFIIEQASKTVV